MKAKKLGLVGLLTLGAGAVASLFSGNANAESIDILLNHNYKGIKYIQLAHTVDATEGFDTEKDTVFVGDMIPSPRIDFYVLNGSNKFTGDAREPNSITDFYSKIIGVGDVNAPATLSFFKTDDGQHNFDWKNFIVELYNEGDVNNPANKLATADGFDLVNNSVSLPALTIHNGLSYQLKVKPRNYADLDGNQQVDFKDFAKLGQSWMISGANPGNTWNNYSNISRTGTTNFMDLELFANEWGWYGDPNTSTR